MVKTSIHTFSIQGVITNRIFSNNKYFLGFWSGQIINCNIGCQASNIFYLLIVKADSLLQHIGKDQSDCRWLELNKYFYCQILSKYPIDLIDNNSQSRLVKLNFWIEEIITKYFQTKHPNSQIVIVSLVSTVQDVPKICELDRHLVVG